MRLSTNYKSVDVFAGATKSFQTFNKYPRVSYSSPYFYNGTSVEDMNDTFCLATKAGDAKWSSFVTWILDGLIQAEENGVKDETAYKMPEVKLFGISMLECSRIVCSFLVALGRCTIEALQRCFLVVEEMK